MGICYGIAGLCSSIKYLTLKTMAELSISQNKRVLPKVDLTAMVDLAFLLITFFMLTTSLSKPVAMDIAKPDNTPDDVRQPWPASRTLTLLLGADNKIAWYMGEAQSAFLQLSTFPKIRKIIIERKQFVAASNPGESKKSLNIIVKPLSGSTYKNFVDMMDEVNLAGLKSAPAIDDEHITDKERLFLK
jgi:biopolymer transport protein ExbD